MWIEIHGCSRGDGRDRDSIETQYIGWVPERSSREPDGPGPGAEPGPALTQWLLSKAERANPQTVLDDPHPGQQAWSVGNHVRPLVHGATYFAELKERIEETRSGDLIMFTDWRGDPDEQLTDDPDRPWSGCSALPIAAGWTCAD